MIAEIDKAHTSLLALLNQGIKATQDSSVNDFLYQIRSAISDNPGKIGISIDDGFPKVSYPKVPEDIYNTRRRVKTRFCKMAKLLLKEAYDNDVANRAQTILTGISNATTSDRFRILKGSDIVEHYRSDPIGECSCMNQCPEATALYAANDNVFMIEVLDKHGEPFGRALVWTTDSGERILDRCYPNNSAASAALRCYASRHNIWVRNHDSYNDGSVEWYDSATGETRSNFEVSLRPASNGLFPYMDSFQYSDDLETFRTQNNDASYELDCVSGGYTTNGVRCGFCNQEITEDAGYTIGSNTLCEDCYLNNYFYCENCGDTFSIDDMVSAVSAGIMPVCTYCADDLYPKCSDCSERIFDADDQRKIDGETVCIECLQSYIACHDCGDYISIKPSMTFNLDIDVPICLDCLHNHHTLINDSYVRDLDAPPIVYDPEKDETLEKVMVTLGQFELPFA